MEDQSQFFPDTRPNKPNIKDRPQVARLRDPIPEDEHDPNVPPPGCPTQTPDGRPLKYDRWGRSYRHRPLAPPEQWDTPSGQWEGPTHTAEALPSLLVFTTKNSKGQYICGAKLQSRENRFCQNTDIGKNGRCSRHGGNVLAGTESPMFKGRGYSRYLPETKQQVYQELLEDPELLSSNHEIALLDLQIGNLVQTIESHEEEGIGSVAIYRALRTQSNLLNQQISMLPPETRPAFREIQQALTEISQKGLSDAELRSSLLTHLESRRRHADSQVDRQLKSKLAVDMRQMEAYAMTMVQTIMEEVEDPALRARIGVRLMNMRQHSTPTHGELETAPTLSHIASRPVSLDLPYAPQKDDVR